MTVSAPDIFGIDRHPGLRLAGDPQRMQSTFINGIRHLPVVVS